MSPSSSTTFPSLERGYRAPTGAESALGRACQCLLGQQNADGHWRAELQGDTILESEYVLLMAFLDRLDDPKVRKAGNYIRSQMRPEGAWSNYPGGPMDMGVSVKAYFALKLSGHQANSPYMRRARQLILEQGGPVNCNSYTKFYLALLGQFPYDNCPSVPPEMMYLPTWAYFNIYAMSSWTRTFVVPLAIFSAHRPVRKIPAQMGIRELFVRPPETRLSPHPPTRRLFTAHNFFLFADQAMKLWERWGPKSVRKAAIRKASAWMREHFADSDGVGAIFPPIIYTIISLRCLGYADDSAEMIYAQKQLDDLMIEEGDTLRVQPCFSPVWDTALSLNAMALANGEGEEEARSIRRAADWLLAREIRRPGDWTVMNPHLEPAGWPFEYHNGFYPDIDDTAMVLMGLARSGLAWTEESVERNADSIDWRNVPSDKLTPQALYDTWRGHQTGSIRAQRATLPAVQRGLRWLLGMQNRNGGWAAFDRNVDHDILTKVPFADHNAMLDPSCPDITARVLEALGQFGYLPDHPQVARAVRFIESTQDRRGCWPGRWGVNYLYGTWQVLIGLDAVGYDMKKPMVRRAVDWLKQVQHLSGAWGESCASYEDPRLAGQGPPTASQTAWAIAALIAAGEADSGPVRRGIDYLVRMQQPDGNWHEDQFTGTGFPKVFYLKYHLYRLYFPLMALARYQRALIDKGQYREVTYPEPVRV